MTTILRFFLFFLLTPVFAIVAQAAGIVQDDFRIVDTEFRTESVALDNLDSEICNYDSSGALLHQRKSLDGEDYLNGHEEFRFTGAAQSLLSFLAEFVAANKLPTGLEARGVKIPGGRKINDTIPGSTKVKNSQGEIFKRVDNPPSRPHGGLESHTHPNFRNVSPDGTVRSGVSKEGIPQTRRDIIDAARDGAQRTGGL